VSFSNFKFGDDAFQIRTTSRKFARWMNAALAPYRVRRKAQVNYSVVIAGGVSERTGARKRFHIFYRGNQRNLRTLDIKTLARGLFDELESRMLPEREDAIYLQAPALAGNGKIAVVPDFYRFTLERMGRRLDRAGVRLPTSRQVAVDPETGQLVPIAPRLEIPGDAIDRLGEMFGTNGAAPMARIEQPSFADLVFVPGPEEEHMQQISRGKAVYGLASFAMNFPKLGARTLEGIAQLVERADCYSFLADATTPENRSSLLTGLSSILKG
jgi:hypothetical protein